MLRACATAEQAGALSVAIVSTGFVHQADALAGALGIEGVAIVEYPGLVMMDSDAEFQAKVTEVVAPEVMAGFTRRIEQRYARRHEGVISREPTASTTARNRNRRTLPDVRQWS